jgi:uncharacterized membrane protein (UPF0127 family)
MEKGLARPCLRWSGGLPPRSGRQPHGGRGGGAKWGIATSWLVCNGLRVAPLAVAALPWERSRGLLGRDGIDGAILLAPAFVVHTFGMRFPIDVAFCDRDLQVVGVTTMGRNRLSRPRIRVRAVVEAQAGAFGGWQLRAGSRLCVDDGDD